MSRLTGRVDRLSARLLNRDEPDLAAEAEAFGRLVSDEPHLRLYERDVDGAPVATLVVGALAYELIGVHAAALA